MTNERSVAIVGAGVSGLGAAYALRRAGLGAVVFERGSTIGGRVATVERGPVRFDTGAQFLRTDTPGSAEIVLQGLPRESLVDIPGEVRPFTADGAVGVGDPAQNGQPKWVYRRGLAELPGLLLAASAATVHLNTEIRGLLREGDGWSLALKRGGEAGPFAAVVVAAPGPAAAEILAGSRGVADDRLVAGHRELRYRTIVSVTWGYAGASGGPAGCYALVNSDRGHAVSWLAFEDQKPGYAPDGAGVLTAQMADGWSRPRMALGDVALAEEARECVRALLPGWSGETRWSHVTRWAEALPDGLLEEEAFRAREGAGLFFTGDGFTGGRVHLALEHGVAVGERVAAADGRASFVPSAN